MEINTSQFQQFMKLFTLIKMDDDFFKNLKNTAIERAEPFSNTVEQSSDRTTAIISACLLDNLLERLLLASYIKDPAVKSIFKNEHVLQSLFTKINIAYFSGLIPKIVYQDLRLIGEIRNRFAHEVTASLGFSSTIISKRIDKCSLRPKTIDDIPDYKLKYILIVQQLIDHLCLFEHLLLVYNPINLVEFFDLENWNWEKATLTKEKIIEVMRKHVSEAKNP